MRELAFAIETRFPIETLDEGCVRRIEILVLVRNCFRVLRILFRKNSVVSSPLYPTGTRVLALLVIIRTSDYIRMKDGGFLSGRNKRRARNDLAFDAKDSFLYRPIYMITQILRTSLRAARKNFSRFNISNTTILQYKMKWNF